VEPGSLGESHGERRLTDMRRIFSTGRLVASVGPLLAPSVSKWARDSARHERRVRPSRAISGIGQVGVEQLLGLLSPFSRVGVVAGARSCW
jgi:hypothetical protein